MRIKKYVAKSMREALLQIKDDLGEEAIILKSRKLPKKVFALGTQDEIEVTAAVDENLVKQESFQPLQMSKTGVYSRPRTSNIIDLEQPGAPEIKSWKPGGDLFREKTKPVLQDDGKEQIGELKENIRELREMMKNVLEKTTGTPRKEPLSDSFAVLRKRLLDAEVKAEIVEKLIIEAEISGTDLSDAQIEKKLTETMNRSFLISGPLKLKKSGPLVVAFIGPTGSGKTTTLAKLAAHCCINKRKKVSIITADTYRIAAIEQIRTFADIVKVGLQVVFSPDEVPDALEACADDDIVLVDTAGRSQRNTEHMQELKALIDALHPDEVHLVMSALTKDSDLADIILHYRPVNVNRLLFTKMDETVKVGSIFNIVSESSIPVSYFTFGQSVPDDIELAQQTRFLQRLWENEKQ